jgi:hypothetical protein
MTDQQTEQQQQQAALIAQADQQAQAFIGPVCVAMLNGIAKSLGTYPVDRMAVTAAGILGRCFGEVLSIGQLGPLMKLRRQCMQQFEDEMKKVHINAPPTPGGSLPPMSADLLRKLNS